jgi:hypothetical protein
MLIPCCECVIINIININKSDGWVAWPFWVLVFWIFVTFLFMIL